MEVDEPEHFFKPVLGPHDREVGIKETRTPFEQLFPFPGEGREIHLRTCDRAPGASARSSLGRRPSGPISEDLGVDQVVPAGPVRSVNPSGHLARGEEALDPCEAVAVDADPAVEILDDQPHFDLFCSGRCLLS